MTEPRGCLVLTIGTVRWVRVDDLQHALVRLIDEAALSGQLHDAGLLAALHDALTALPQ
jgi:hypothetical protein